MKLSLLYNTIRYLKLTQIVGQIRVRLCKQKIHRYHVAYTPITTFATDFIVKDTSYYIDKKFFNFLNINHKPCSWNDVSQGMLWAYNLNYMDWILQADLPAKEGIIWVDRFVEEFDVNTIGKEPYTIALRGINWIKFIVNNRDDIPEDKIKKWNDCLYGQFKWLSMNLETHLLGNHILEDLFSLLFASIYFKDKKFFHKSTKNILEELSRQILEDGAHFEQSPMYHCIMLDRLLDCYNYSTANPLFDNQIRINSFLLEYAKKMLGHLEKIVWNDKTIPLVNDSALGIAPTPSQIFDYAKRLKIEWRSVELKSCGYRKLSNSVFEALIDVGNITATYQPGHSHADTFSYELRINSIPLVCDTGISTYNKTQRRQFERSTYAHNTVVIDNRNSSDVWGGFRVGKRAEVVLITDTSNIVGASHSGYKPYTHIREFEMTETYFSVKDTVDSSSGISIIHFAPCINIIKASKDSISTDLVRIEIDGADEVWVEDEVISQRYNLFEPVKVVKIKFSNTTAYRFIPN